MIGNLSFDSSQKSQSAHLSSKVSGGELNRIKDMEKQLDELITSLTRTKEVISYIKDNYEADQA